MDLPDARSLSSESLELLRTIAVHAVLELGMTHREAAAIVGVGENAVGQWCAAYRKAGTEGLEVRPQGRPLGSGRFLTTTQEIVIQAILRDATPQDYNIPLEGWNRKAVRALIQKRFQIDLTLQSVGQYLARWNMTPQKPNRHAREQDEEEVREFVEETLPDALKRADEEGASLHFADETGAQAFDQIGARYAPKGQTPTQEVPQTRIKQNLISSVTPEGEVFSWLFSGTMDTETFLEFLERFVAWTEEKAFLFLDHLPAHKANKVEAWVREHSDQIEIVWLPRYSPEYNPDEFLNNDLKQNLENQPLPETQDEFTETIRRILADIRRFPERVIGYFRKAKLDLGLT